MSEDSTAGLPLITRRALGGASETPPRMQLLIADDHEIVRRGLRDLLRGHSDWEICAEAANGIEAVDLAIRIRPNLAILDLTMPLLNGLDAARRIRGEAPETEILLFTTDESEDLGAQALEAGASGCLLKSRPASELVEALESISHRARPIPAEPPCGPPLATRAIAGVRTSRALTSRQREILQLIAEGKANKEVARILGIGVRTVETHRANVMKKLGVRSLVQLVRYAVRNHIVDA